MVATSNELTRRIGMFPGDQTESEWLNAFSFLRSALSQALTTHAHIGCYYIDDFPRHAGAAGYSRIRAGTPVPGIDSDSWEGVLCWSGNRDSRAYASALIIPFHNDSAVQPQGRIADLGADAEVNKFLLYRFEDGVFKYSGWQCCDGPGEWAHVTVPGTLFCRDLTVDLRATMIESNMPIYVDLTIPDLQAVRSNSDTKARISLIHVNRDRESTNLSPWTANPPTDTRNSQSLSTASFPTSNVMRIRLDAFNIRGGWIAGKYHLSLRVQNFHKPTDWAWSSAISKPIKLEIV